MALGFLTIKKEGISDKKIKMAAKKKKVSKKPAAKKTKAVKKSIPEFKSPNKKVASSKPATMGEAISYPMINWKVTLNYLWFLVPFLIGYSAIFGLIFSGPGFTGVGAMNSMQLLFGLIIVVGLIIAFFSYVTILGFAVKVTQELLKNNKNGLPEFKYKDNLGKGWKALLYELIIVAIMILIAKTVFAYTPTWLVVIIMIYIVLVLPLMYMQFCEKRSILDGLGVVKATKIMFKNFWGYILAILKMILLNIVLVFFGVIGWGAAAFAKHYHIVDYYRRMK